MLNFELDRDAGLLVLRPAGALVADDFSRVAAVVDPYLEESGRLNGVMIWVEEFPGWQDFGAMLSHLKFVCEHHKQIAKVAVVSDSKLMETMPKAVDHFINAKVKHFDFEDSASAREWIAA